MFNSRVNKNSSGKKVVNLNQVPNTKDLCFDCPNVKSRPLRPIEFRVYILCNQIKKLNPYNHNHLQKAGILLQSINEEIQTSTYLRELDEETNNVLTKLWNDIVNYVKNFFTQFIQSISSNINNTLQNNNVENEVSEEVQEDEEVENENQEEESSFVVENQQSNISENSNQQIIPPIPEQDDIQYIQPSQSTSTNPTNPPSTNSISTTFRKTRK